MQSARDNKDIYLKHFGFEKRPFGAVATGGGVFVGPQAARTIADFRKGVAKKDAVVTISGRKGTGKTTLVHRALDALGIKYKTIRVGRLKMNSSEVLESLLIVLGVRDRPAGTMQRFAALRKTLKEHQDRDVRIFIVIEDAVRTGIEALAEIEAMTAANAGDSDGASIVVMGNEDLAGFLNDAQLTELRQRITKRQAILPMSAPELRGYLVHTFRHAGANFHQIFDATSVELLYQLSAGIPRLTYRVAEAAMIEAARKGLQKISASFVATVARDKLGLKVDGFHFSALEADGASAAESAGSDTSATAVAASGVSQEPQSAVEFAPDAEQGTAGSDEIPLLIQDTLADQKVLSPATTGYRNAANNDNAVDEPRAPTRKVPEPEPDFAATIIPQLTPDLEIVRPERSERIPTLQVNAEPPTEIVPELEYDEDEMATMVPVPDVFPDRVEDGSAEETAVQWDAEPASPEFEPDLDALEQAMALANSDSVAALAVDTEGRNSEDVTAEFTEDGASEPSMNINLLENLDESSQRPEKQAEVELDQVAAEIGNPESLADVDDRLAETLFGSEFRCLSDEEILEMQRADAGEETPPADAGQSRPTVIPVAQEAAVGTLVSANDEDSGEAGNTGPKAVKSLYMDLHPSLLEPAVSTSGRDTMTSAADASKRGDTPTPSKKTASGDDRDEQNKAGFFNRFRRT